MPAVGEHDVGLLKRQLQVLNYQDSLDTSSYELVKKLVADLVHTTETYQSLKQQCGEQQQEIASFRSKIEAIKTDSSRVVRENNALHAQLIRRDDESDAQQAAHYQRMKELESEVAELSFWKNQATARMEQSEKVKYELQERLADLMKLGFAGPRVQDYGRLTASSSMDAEQPTIGPEHVARDVEVLHAVEQRLAQVQQEVHVKEAKLNQIDGETKLLRLSLQHRDDEIQRLSAKLDVDRAADVATLSLRNETNEAIILSLNQQVDVLSSQVAKLENDVKDAEGLRSNLQKAQAGKVEAEKKLFEAVNDNACIQEQVAELQKEVSRIKADTAKKLKPNKLEERTVLEHVTNLQTALDKANSSQVQEKHKSLHTEKQREASLRRESQLRGKVDGLKSKLEKAEKSVQLHERKIEDLRKTLAATKQREDKGEMRIHFLQGSLAELSEKSEEVRKMLHDKARRLEACETDKNVQDTEVLRLRSVEAAAGRELVELQSTVDEMAAEKQRLETQLSAINEDREALQEQLRETVKLKTTAVAGGAQLQGDHDRLLQEVNALQKRLTAANLQLDAAIAERDQFELQASKNERALSLMQEERDVLQADLLQSRQQWQEHRERLSATEGELGHLSGLRSRSEALEAELKSASSRLAATESECSRLRSDMERWRKAAGDEEDKALSAQAGLRDVERRHADCQHDLTSALSDCDIAKAKLNSCENSVAALKDEQDRLRAALQLKEQAVQSERKQAQDLEYKLQGVEHATGNDRQLIMSKDEELNRQKAQIDKCQQTIQSWQDKHRESMAELSVATDKARQHAALVEEYKNDLESARLQLEDERSKYAEQGMQVSEIKRELASAQTDVDQLKTLVLASSRTQANLESQLTSQASEVRAARSKLELAKDDVKQKQEEVDKLQQQLAQSQSVVRQIDSARDQLQVELDAQAEENAQLEVLCQQAQSSAAELNVNRKTMEQRLNQADNHISHLQNEVKCAEQRECMCKHNLLALQEDFDRLQEETTALSEDLAVMVKENQLITSQLGDTTQRMEESRKDGDAAHASAGILQQTVKARELELGDLRTAYEGLAAEARHHEATISQLKRQLTGSATELEGAKREVLHVRDTAHSSQQQIQQYVVDVQALERNSDALARELQGSKREAEELASDRNRVLEQMQAIQGMRYEAERSRDNLQQEVARLDSQLHVSNARLEEAHAEVRKCTSNDTVLHKRISELEKLTETMREKEFSMSQLLLQQETAGPGQLKEKCQNLQLQVHSMEQELRAAHAHITRLHEEVRQPEQLYITDEPHPGDGVKACQAELDEARNQAAEAFQELAIVRRQLEICSTTAGHGHNNGSIYPESDMEQKVKQMQRKAHDLELANAELQSRANSLKDDKDRLLRMVSRSELERHHLHSLRAQQPAQQPESSGSGSPVPLDRPADGCTTGPFQAVACIETSNRDNLYIESLTDLIELNELT